MSSLDRLIKLAKRTGDRLIVHNETDESDIVIMDVDQYENLLNENQDGLTNSSRDVRGLSERQLLNQINRDIAIWRANDKLESGYEEDLPELPDNKSDWHSAGSVLEELNLEEIPAFETQEETIEKEGIVQENSSKGLISDDEPVFYEEPV